MALKDILIHIDNLDTCAARLDTAIKIAQAHDAYLIGLYVIPDFNIPAYAEVHIPVEIIATQEEQARATADQVKATFLKTAEQAGCAAAYHCVQGIAGQQIKRNTRFVDLTVISQTEEAHLLTENSDLPDRVVLGSASPVLCVPYIGAQHTIGQRVLIAWNGSREAARTVNDALPLLQRAEQVDVVAFNPPAGASDLPTVDICDHLARHGVTAKGNQMTDKDIDVGDLILSRAADIGADLIVMGAYGHSRFRELILGGVTRHMLAHMTVPILMSH